MLQNSPNPRMFGFDAKSRKDFAKAVIKFLECPFTNKREVSVYNTHGPLIPRPGYIMPENLYAASFSDQDDISENDVLEALRDNDFMFQGIAALDISDEERVGLTAMPGTKTLLFMAYSDKTSVNTINEIMDYIKKGLE